MERLTERELYDEKVCFTKCAQTNCPDKCAFCDIPKEAEKKLKEYEDLEESGQLVKLPCKLGCEVWYIDNYESSYTAEIIRGVVDGYLWFRTCGFALNCVWDKPLMGNSAYCRKEMPFSEIGKSVFLTHDQAEQALKEMEGSHGENKN